MVTITLRKTDTYHCIVKVKRGVYRSIKCRLHNESELQCNSSTFCYWLWRSTVHRLVNVRANSLIMVDVLGQLLDYSGFPGPTLLLGSNNCSYNCLSMLNILLDAHQLYRCHVKGRGCLHVTHSGKSVCGHFVQFSVTGRHEATGFYFLL